MQILYLKLSDNIRGVANIFAAKGDVVALIEPGEKQTRFESALQKFSTKNTDAIILAEAVDKDGAPPQAKWIAENLRKAGVTTSIFIISNHMEVQPDDEFLSLGNTYFLPLFKSTEPGIYVPQANMMYMNVATAVKANKTAELPIANIEQAHTSQMQAPEDEMRLASALMHVEELEIQLARAQSEAEDARLAAEQAQSRTAETEEQAKNQRLEANGQVAQALERPEEAETRMASALSEAHLAARQAEAAEVRASGFQLASERAHERAIATERRVIDARLAAEQTLLRAADVEAQLVRARMRIAETEAQVAELKLQLTGTRAINKPRLEWTSFYGFSFNRETEEVLFCNQQIPIQGRQKILLGALILAQGDAKLLQREYSMLDETSITHSQKSLYSRVSRLHQSLRSSLVSMGCPNIPLVEAVDGVGWRLSSHSLQRLAEFMPSLLDAAGPSPIVQDFEYFGLSLRQNRLQLNGHPISLSPTHSNLMRVLILADDEFVPFNVLHQARISDNEVGEHTTWKQISDLRKELGKLPSRGPIVEHIKGRGYRINVENLGAPAILRTPRLREYTR